MYEERDHFDPSFSHCWRCSEFVLCSPCRYAADREWDFDYVGDFGAMEDREPAEEDLFQSIADVMEEPTYVEENSGLVRAFAFIYKHQLSDLPVVNDEGKLVGLASRVDIGRALLATWWQCMQENESQ
jgi:hypothetical protein